MNEDMSELKAKYLFLMANICHITPNEIDATDLRDFASLTLAVDRYIEARK